MSSPYSPIDESSYNDSSFDPEAILNSRSSTYNNNNPAPGVGQENVAAQNRVDEPTASASTVQTPADGSQSEPTSRQAGRVAPENKNSDRKKETSAMSQTFNLIRDSRTVLFLGIVLVIFAGYSLIVALSYFHNIGNDQSAMLNGDYSPEMIKNAGGPFGAWLAHALIYNWLGLGAFIMIYYFGMCGISMLNVYRPSFWRLTMRCLLTSVALSIICGFATYNIASPIYWGGLHGHRLNEKLMIMTGFWGALAVSLIMGGLVVVVYLGELKRAFSFISAGVNAYRARQAERRAERERIREAEEAERCEREAAEAAARREAEDAAARQAAAEREQSVIVAQPEPQQPSATAASQSQTGSQIPTPTPVPADNDPYCSLFGSAARVDSDRSDDDEEEDDSDDDVVSESDEIPASLFADEPVDDDDDDEKDVDTDSSDTDIAPLFAGGESLSRKPTVEEVLNQEPFDPRAELSNYQFPSVELLIPSKNTGVSVDAREMEENKVRITDTLNHYGIPISKIEATVGPTVTLYEIIPAEGVRIAKIKRLEDDIALSLAALGIRIIAPIPGKGTIGIEVPNKDPQIVSMRSIIESPTFVNSRMELPMAMGRTISNDVFMADLCKMPHLLVAGATGMGKSVGLNAIIASLLYKKHPSELKFVLIDPKMVEFSLYARLEHHYLAKLPDEEDAIITDPMKVVATLNSLCVEMDNRYALLKEASMRNIKEYNDKFVHRQLNPEKGHKYLPYIVVIVDEFADLIMTAGKEVETPIARIAQKARAVGIHMILATQRPSTNVITGIIKANFPGRIAFRVFQMVDSRTILDRPGANQLIGRGDMLFSNNGKLDRVQCAFIDTPEVSAICDSINEQVGYASAYELPEYIAEASDGSKLASVGDRDPLFDECARLVVTTDTASTSSLQRRYSIGYNRAGKIMDQMEAAGIVGPSQGGKPRQVLVDSLTLERILENN